MTRTDILIRFIKKSIVPIITAILLYNLFAGLCIANGNLNYMYLLMLCGIPFGIRFMFTLPVFIGDPVRRHFYDCCQHSNRCRNRRHNLNMEIACRRLLCAVHRC